VEFGVIVSVGRGGVSVIFSDDIGVDVHAEKKKDDVRVMMISLFMGVFFHLKAVGKWIVSF